MFAVRDKGIPKKDQPTMRREESWVLSQELKSEEECEPALVVQKQENSFPRSTDLGHGHRYSITSVLKFTGPSSRMFLLVIRIFSFS
jgi:hypothetical protein